MLSQLHAIIKDVLPNLLTDVRHWDSLLINRRRPITQRLFTMHEGVRICLHRFNYIDDVKDGGEAFMHPHPWPGAFHIVDGSYRMALGYTNDRHTKDPTICSQLDLTAGSSYEITSPLVWHSVTPLTLFVRTVMINGERWPSDVAHTAVRTTQGKDLEKVSRDDMIELLANFSLLLYKKLLHPCGKSENGFCKQGESHFRCLHCGKVIP